jgi:hypothetical protein
MDASRGCQGPWERELSRFHGAFPPVAGGGSERLGARRVAVGWRWGGGRRECVSWPTIRAQVPPLGRGVRRRPPGSAAPAKPGSRGPGCKRRRAKEHNGSVRRSACRRDARALLRDPLPLGRPVGRSSLVGGFRPLVDSWAVKGCETAHMDVRFHLSERVFPARRRE